MLFNQHSPKINPIMAKLPGPLFSLHAQQSIARTLTYQHAPSTNRATLIPTHPDANSPAQQQHRTLYLAACTYWNALHEHEKEFYNYLASQVEGTGFNYCIASYIFGFIP